MITNYYLPEESEDIKLMKLPQKAKGRTKILGARGDLRFVRQFPKGIETPMFKIITINY